MAMQFNLLPWREEQRQAHFNRTKNILLLGVALGLVFGFGYYFWEKFRLEDHNKALQFVRSENTILNRQLAEYNKLKSLEKKLSNQVDAIESLQANRSSVSHMIEELSKANNQDLFLTRFSLNDGYVSISGVAKNDSQISDLMKNLRESPWYQEPKLLEIISSPELGEEAKKFSISSNLLLPGKENIDRGSNDS